MKLVMLLFSLVLIVVLVEGTHTFMGTNVMRPVLFHSHQKFGAKAFRKRVEELKYQIPSVPSNYGRVIQGIIAYDLTDSGATANVTSGGLGTNFVTLRMKSSRGMKLDYDVYIYA